MKFSIFNVYIIVLIIWFVYSFIKKRKAAMERQRRTHQEENRNFEEKSDDDILRNLKNLIEGRDSNTSYDPNDDEYEDEEDEYVTPPQSTSNANKEQYENEIKRRLLEEKSILEKQRILEEFTKRKAAADKLKDANTVDVYNYSLNKNKAISIFKESHEDLRKAIIYNAILERRGKKIR